MAIKDPTGSTKHRDDDLPETDDHGSTITSRDKDPLSASKPNAYDDNTNDNDASENRRLSFSPAKNDDQSSKTSGDKTPSMTKKTTSPHINLAIDPLLNPNLTRKIEFHKSINL